MGLVVSDVGTGAKTEAQYQKKLVHTIEKKNEIRRATRLCGKVDDVFSPYPSPYF